MTVTAFGGLFLPLSIFVFLFRRRWLLPLLCVAAVLQSPSVVNLAWGGGVYGVTAFLLVSGLTALDLVLRIRREGFLCLGEGEQRRALGLWLAFGAVSMLGALLLPIVFSGQEVYAPLDREGVRATRQALTWSISNLAQMLNLALILVAMLWVVQQRRDPLLSRRMWVGMGAALVVSTLAGLQQRLGWNGLLPLWDSFWASNPTYVQNYRSWAGPVPRVNWPLVDASYASAWFAAVFGGFAAMFLADAQRSRALAGALLALFALANTVGATGVLAVGLYGAGALLVAIIVVVLRPQLRGGMAYRLVLGALAASCALLACYLVARNYALFDETRSAFESLQQRWYRTVLGPGRYHADNHALKLAAETWGLGVGMGSNRASSYMTTLFGNTGWPGLLLFLVALSYQLHLLIQSWRRRPEGAAMFFLGGALAALLAMTIAIPDQNWPIFWLMVLGGLACLGAERPVRSAASGPIQAAGDRKADQRAI